MVGNQNELQVKVLTTGLFGSVLLSGAKQLQQILCLI